MCYLRVVTRVIGAALVVAGLAVFLYPNFKDMSMQSASKEFISTVDASESTLEEPTVEPEVQLDQSQTVLSVVTENIQKDTEYLKENVQPEFYQALSEYNTGLVENGQSIVDVFSYEDPPFDLSVNGDSAVIGTLNIPDMKVKDMPLYMGASADNLSKGAAVMSQTSMPIGGVNTNSVIAAHRGFRGSAFFQFIENLTEGSLVYITNPWETLVYKVTEMKIVDPNDIGSVKIQEGKDMVTLLTCHPYVVGGGPERYLAYCERVSADEAGLLLVNNDRTEDVVSSTLQNIQDVSEDEAKEMLSQDAVLVDSSLPGRLDTDTGKVDEDSYTPVVNVINDSEPLIVIESYMRWALPIALLFLFVVIKFVIYLVRSRRKTDQFR